MADDVKPEQFTMPIAVAIIGMFAVFVSAFLVNNYLQILAAQIVMWCK